MAKYFGRILLAMAVVFVPLLILAVVAELYKQRTSPSDLWVGLRLIRDMMPALLAVGVALLLTAKFVEVLYALDGWQDGLGHVWRGIFGRRSFGPLVLVSGGKVNERGGDSVLTRVGGRGGILVYNDSAAVLEQGGRLTRVVRPGKLDSLELFEKVRDVIDLRPMRWEYKVSALTREGIPVTMSADVTFQIDTGGREPKDKSPYPALDEAIFKASTCRWMRAPESDEDDQYFDWARRVIISDTEGSLRGIIARYSLDALVGLEDDASSPREAIQGELTQALQKSCASLGAQINEVRLGAIEVDDKVAGQWVEAWGNEWRYRTLVQEKAVEAIRKQRREAARAQAQIDIITAVAMAFQRFASGDDRIPAQLLIMRLIEVFDRSPHTYLPKQALETLEYLRGMILEGRTERDRHPIRDTQTASSNSRVKGGG
jgi:hypothetical protein